METIREKNHLRLVKSTYQPGFAKVHASDTTPRGYGPYYQRIEGYAHRIRETDNVMTIIDILDQALTETRGLESKYDDQITPAKLSHAELEIQSLKEELEQLRGLVHIDHLTGTLNRSGLHESFARETARAERAGTLLAVALLDLDDFKLLNDRYGHQTGDDALVHLANIIRKTLRPSDVVVRFGGEEFLFLLPDATAEQTMLALLRIQNDLDKQPMIYNNSDILLSFSAGIAIRGNSESRDAVIARADAAMYAAKRAGKRQVCKSD